MELEAVPFSELLSEVIDNRGKTCPTVDSGLPLIATNCIRNELLYPTYEKARFVSPDTYSTWFRGHPKPGDILFVNKATPGRVCLVPDPVDFCIAQDMVAVRADPKRIYPRFLFAALRSPIVQERIEQMHVGTLIPHFKKGDFDKLLIPVPDRRAQEFIGDIYFELSAKIDLNRRMNETLKAMAQALFKSWFVDFLPVRAKMAAAKRQTILDPLPAAEDGAWFVYALECDNGSLYIGYTEDLQQRWHQHVSGCGARWTKAHPPVRVAHWESLPSRQEAVDREKWLKTGFGRRWLKQQVAAANARTQTGDPVRAKAAGRDPGLPKAIADLFPNCFEDSNLGEIPKGWLFKPIEDVAERVAMGPFGSSIKVETFVPEGVPIISGQHLHGFMLEDSTFNFITQEHATRLHNAVVQRGDVVFTHAGNIGQAAFIPRTSRYERYVISQRQFYMRCDLSQVTPAYIALYFNSPEGRHQLLANTSSSGVPSIARPVTYLRSIHIPVPPATVLATFERLLLPLLLRFSQNMEINRTLSALRDALLPKLISGEIRVGDAERFVKKAQ